MGDQGVNCLLLSQMGDSRRRTINGKEIIKTVQILEKLMEKTVNCAPW